MFYKTQIWRKQTVLNIFNSGRQKTVYALYYDKYVHIIYGYVNYLIV